MEIPAWIVSTTWVIPFVAIAVNQIHRSKPNRLLARPVLVSISWKYSESCDRRRSFIGDSGRFIEGTTLLNHPASPHQNFVKFSKLLEKSKNFTNMKNTPIIANIVLVF
jgi:hypothetical protein